VSCSAAQSSSEGSTAAIVERLLVEELGLEVAGVEKIGAGAWSECFGFEVDGSRRVIRLGRHVEDFEKDLLASEFSGPDLPVPAVVDIGSALGSHYAISERVEGSPLELSDDWDQLIDPIARALDSLRTIDLRAVTGWGAWDASGHATSLSWSDFLLAVDVDSPDRRTHGWRGKLAASASTGVASFRAGYKLLEEVSGVAVPRSLIHADLINCNVHVVDGRITGVFDWGCSIYGDHLYELAWMEFWEPWHPLACLGSIREALERIWDDTGYVVDGGVDRIAACYLHIGLDHLAYHAHIEDWDGLTKVEARMRELIAAF